MRRQQQTRQTRQTVRGDVPAAPYGYAYIDEQDDAYAAVDDDDRRSGFMARVRSHPVPVTLAGVGLGWLAFSQSRQPRACSHGRLLRRL
jgi:hypothetical protein